MMGQLSNVPVTMPNWWESLRPYEPQCLHCRPIWLLCLVDDTGSWDGGSAMRIGSQIMLELINRQQWLLPGYELMCEFFNHQCDTKTASQILAAGTTQNKYVALGGSGHSGVSNRLSRVAFSYRMPYVSWGSGAPDLSHRKVHRNFFRTVVPHTALTFVWIRIYLMGGWRRIVLVRLTPERRFAHNHFEHTVKGGSVQKVETLKNIFFFKCTKLKFEDRNLQSMKRFDGDKMWKRF